MTHEQTGNNPEHPKDDKFEEITGQLATHLAFEGGQLVHKVVDKGKNQVELPDTPFEISEAVGRSGKP